MAWAPWYQFPTGVPLAPKRRTEVIRWARSTGAVVLEDDYDGEFRYDRQPIGALQGLAPDVVAYAGSARPLHPDCASAGSSYRVFSSTPWSRRRRGRIGTVTLSPR
jgi:hypothetical protein